MSHKVLTLVLLLLSSIFVGEGIAFTNESPLSKNYFYIDSADKSDCVIFDDNDETLSLYNAPEYQFYLPLAQPISTFCFTEIHISYKAIRAPPSYTSI
jgi:hypothetical protein